MDKRSTTCQGAIPKWTVSFGVRADIGEMIFKVKPEGLEVTGMRIEVAKGNARTKPEFQLEIEPENCQWTGYGTWHDM